MIGTLRIEFLSDWHIGEGAGSFGHIDRVIRRHPEDDLPFVPAKTLTGILRDGCERIARGLDDAQPDGPWQGLLREIFGAQSKGADDVASTTAARLSIGPARLPEGLRAGLAEQAALRAALTFVKPGVALDEEGCSREGMLRFEEVAIAGCVLEAPFSIDLPPGDALDAVLALLAAGARAVERIGGKRRRGLGRCNLRLDATPTGIAGFLSRSPAELPAPAAPTLSLAVPDVPNAGQGWHAIPLELELLAPIAVPMGTAGNVISSRDHIPGSLLLPALDRRLRVLFGDRAHRLTALVAAGSVRILNAYPGIGGSRALPAPAALMAAKENPGDVVNEMQPRAADPLQRKQMRAGYVPEDGLPEVPAGISPLVTVRCIATTHSVIDDPVQRPTARVGGVYTYESIAPGQRLHTRILVRNSALGDIATTKPLEGKVRIGRSKKDDYGIAEIRAGKAVTVEPAERASVQAFNIWLVSGLLARDEKLRPITDADAFAAWLGRRLDCGLSVEKAFVRTFRDDGWNSAWNEPRPSRFGLAAGSCLRLASDKPLDGAVLSAMELEGLGERRGEGYGEVRVDPGLLSQEIPARRPSAAGSTDAGAARILVPDDFSTKLHERAWRLQIRRQSMSRAPAFAREMGWTDKQPANSQLGALRSQFEDWKDNRRFAAWLSHLMETPNRRQAWPQGSLERLQACARDDSHVWTLLDAREMPLLPGHDADALRRALAAEATTTFWLTTIGIEMDRRAVGRPAAREAGHGA